jgi:predicted  nucleic acid-binding Zn-ribbon protein
MRLIPFKALLALVVLPPILYIGAIQGLEDYLAHYYRREILNRIPGDTQALLSGRTHLVHQIEATIDDLFAASDLLHRGVVLSVAIRTGSGRRIYPPVYDEGLSPESGIDPMRTASENFVLLNEGLDVTLSVSIVDNTTVSNSVLAFAILIALTGLVILYRRGDRILEREALRRAQEAEAIQAHENEQKSALANLEVQKENLTAQVTAIEAELAAAHERAARNEADLFDEVESLENKLHNTLQQQQRQQNRIRELERHLERLAKERQALTAQQVKASEGLRKRLEALYKQTSFSERSINGLAELTEPLQIKAEEIIHQLDAQTDDVPIKRKLFRGKGKETVFEIVFARKGRLYFRRTRDRKVEVLAIGTKNTQDKDLVYLDRTL